MKFLTSKMKLAVLILLVIGYITQKYYLGNLRSSRIISIVWLLIFAAVATGTFDKEEVKPEEQDEEDPDTLSDEEMDEFVLKDGEFSYENYDEVCCPKCGDYLGKGVMKCSSCGHNKGDLPEVCEYCGKPREEALDFCPYCNRYYNDSNKDINNER